MINTQSLSKWLNFLLGSRLLLSLLLFGCGDMSAAQQREAKEQVE